MLADDWRTVWALEADALAAFWAGDTDWALDSPQEMVARSQRVHRFLSGPAQLQLGVLSTPLATRSPRVPGSQRSMQSPPTGCSTGMEATVGSCSLERSLPSGRRGGEETAERALRRADAAGLCQQMATARCAARRLVANGEPEAADGTSRRRLRLPTQAGNPLLSARGRAPRESLWPRAAGERARAIAELRAQSRRLGVRRRPRGPTLPRASYVA